MLAIIMSVKVNAFSEKAHQMKILPTIDEVLQDDWLDNVRSTKAFQDFIAKIEKQEKFC